MRMLETNAMKNLYLSVALHTGSPSSLAGLRTTTYKLDVVRRAVWAFKFRRVRSRLILLAPLVLLNLTGCMATSYDNAPRVTSFSRPALHTLESVGVGQSLMSAGRNVETYVLVVPVELKIGTYRIPAGEYEKLGANTEAEFFSIANMRGKRVSRGHFADTPESIAIRTDGQLCVVTTAKTSNCAKDRSYKLES